MNGKMLLLQRLSDVPSLPNASFTPVEKGYLRILKNQKAVCCDFDNTWIKPKGLALLAAYKEKQKSENSLRRRETVRYAITTGIALLALLLSVIAILAESQVLPLRELLGLPPLP